MKSQLLRSVVALALASSLVPAAPQTTRTSVNPSQGPGAVEHVSVEELLAAGDYVPGEAIALVRTGGDLGATYAAETLAEVDGDAVKLAYRQNVVSAVLAYAFFGLDQLGEEMEEPFGLESNDLPLDAMVRTVEIDLLDSLGVQPLPEPLQPRQYLLQ